ncbi:hypothetical protein ACLB2K_011905 [Fragaria x ananassa]
MFLSASVSEQLTWHSSHHSQDGKMRHPVDSVCWSSIDKKYPTFASNPRNLRFGLATDGFNPFSNLSSTHSLWPVILVIYNLPPNVCMSSENLMLSLLIPGPKQPENDIDVYLQPLIDDLKLLWDGVDMYDAYSKAMFNLRGILLWTINDFPAYGNLSGLTNKGEFACPVCGPETCSYWLPLALKTVYVDHRRFLPTNHVFRRKHKWFNGRKERRVRPKIFTGRATILALSQFTNKWGKKKEKQKKLKKGDPAKLLKKKSLLFELPYWEELLVRHNLDVIHIEKNACESVLDTILDVKGKSKIGAASRRDLELQELMEDVPVEAREDMLDSSGPYTLTKPEKAKFLWRLWMQRFPDGYCSNIGKCIKIKDSKILGLKSHDHHVLMQQLLSVAVKGILPEGVRKSLFGLSSFFHELCQRVLDKKRLEELEDEIVETLCLLERYFPPSFFSIMIHLTIHIAREAKLCGPVHYRYMKVLKGYVRNSAAPEGSIVENYLADECVRTMPIGRKRTRTEEQQEPEGNPRIEAAPNIEQEAGGSEVTPNGGKTKKRGKTTLQVIPTGESQRQTIEWNEKGQLVGAQSVKFSSAVGCIVREQVPINIHDWRLVEDKTKNEVWGLLLQQYKVDLIHKPYILQQMGRLWRAYKSELTGSVMTVLESRRNRTETARLLGLIRPEDVPQAEWDQFVAERSTGEWKAKSEKMKAVRAKQLLPHTLSRKGYVREEYEHAEMEAKLAEQPPTEGPIPVKHDVLSQVLGKEKNGRVRGMGEGITPSRVDAQLQKWRLETSI